MGRSNGSMKFKDCAVVVLALCFLGCAEESRRTGNEGAAYPLGQSHVEIFAAICSDDLRPSYNRLRVIAVAVDAESFPIFAESFKGKEVVRWDRFSQKYPTDEARHAAQSVVLSFDLIERKGGRATVMCTEAYTSLGAEAHKYKLVWDRRTGKWRITSKELFAIS